MVTRTIELHEHTSPVNLKNFFGHGAWKPIQLQSFSEPRVCRSKVFRCIRLEENTTTQTNVTRRLRRNCNTTKHQDKSLVSQLNCFLEAFFISYWIFNITSVNVS